MVILLVAFLSATCAASLMWLVRSREVFLNYRAGSLSRRWISEQAVKIMADRDSTVEARTTAETLLCSAYHPISLKEIRATKNKVDDAYIKLMEERFGQYYLAIRDMFRHVAILCVLNDRASGRYIRKFVEGHHDLDVFLLKMKDTSMQKAKSSENENVDVGKVAASDLAGSFARMDHGRILVRLIQDVESHRQVACV